MGLGREGTDQVVRRSQTTPSSPPVARDHDETTQRRQNCLVVGKHPHPTVSYYFRIEDGRHIHKERYTFATRRDFRSAIAHMACDFVQWTTNGRDRI